jgi:glutathione synthase/RimK-type ligase-like ATP-grasp enzyme/ActR/RegA family two-component response regulator
MATFRQICQASTYGALCHCLNLEQMKAPPPSGALPASRHGKSLGGSTVGAYRILVVVDDPKLLTITRLSLAKNGFEVEAATTAYDGLATLGSYAYDLVILDTALPDLSGWEVLRRIRDSGDVPVMLLTSRDSDVDKARGLDLGADDYLTKPFSFLEFEARVRALLRRARISDSDWEYPTASVSPVGDDLTVAIIVEQRHLGKRALMEARSALEAAGCSVPLMVPDADHAWEIPSEPPPWDAVLSRGRDLAGLGILAAASALGIVTINTPQSIELVRNKVAMHAVLQEHGIPLPKTWFAADVRVFRSLPQDCFPLVVKPYDGDGSAGLSLLTCPQDVDLLPALKGKRSLYLAQEFLEADGWDLKLYGIGNRVWGVRKPSPVSFPEPGPAVERPNKEAAELVDLDAQLRDIGLTCGRACGLELWGVDVAMTLEGPYVIEVNDFPTYSAVPGAGAAIAQHVLTLVQINAVTQEIGRERTLSMVRNPW